jgi:release factor glutamine methyltransferase
MGEGDDDADGLGDWRGDDGDVYGPAEDSRLLLEAALERVGPGDLVLEVGVGSGFVAGRVTDGTGARVIGSDLNPVACRAAREGGVDSVRADLVAPFREKSFDAVLFNPPYLPTPPELEREDWMERALSGGPDGRRVVDPFLDSVGRVLAPGGRVLLLVSSLTGIEAVRERARANGLVVAPEPVLEESFPFERLAVLEITTEHEMA